MAAGKKLTIIFLFVSAIVGIVLNDFCGAGPGKRIELSEGDIFFGDFKWLISYDQALSMARQRDPNARERPLDPFSKALHPVEKGRRKLLLYRDRVMGELALVGLYFTEKERGDLYKVSIRWNDPLVIYRASNFLTNKYGTPSESMTRAPGKFFYMWGGPAINDGAVIIQNYSVTEDMTASDMTLLVYYRPFIERR